MILKVWICLGGVQGKIPRSHTQDTQYERAHAHAPKHAHIIMYAGSLRNRFVTDEEKEAGVSVLKDVNFVLAGQRLKLGPTFGPSLVTQLRKDTDWLKAHAIMDYSLLVGISLDDPITHVITKEPDQALNAKVAHIVRRPKIST